MPSLSRFTRTCPIAGITLLLCGVILTPQSAYAEKTIKVNFDSTADFEESGTDKGTATKSTLTAAQRAAVIAKVQKEYDDAVGAGKVKVSEGSGGNYDMTVSGGRAPTVNSKYGNAGKPGKTGLTYEGEFTADGFTGDELVNGIAETVAHEAGHKLGLNHNSDSPPTKMTSTDTTPTIEQRKADSRSFNDDDKKILSNSLALGNAEQKDTFMAGDLGVMVGQMVPPPPNKPDDYYLNSFVSFNAADGVNFGYISHSNEFVFQGDNTDTFSHPGEFTFLYTAGTDFAVQVGGEIFSLEDGFGSIALSDMNPFNPNDFQMADITFHTSFGTDELLLNATIDPTTGGFFLVPEPPAWLLLASGFASLLSIRWWRRQRRFCRSGAGPGRT